MVSGVLGAEIDSEPARKARRAIPSEPVQIVTEGVKWPLMRAKIHGLVDRLLTKLLKPGGLQQFLEGGHIVVPNRPWLEGLFVHIHRPPRHRAVQNWGAQHL